LPSWEKYICWVSELGLSTKEHTRQHPPPKKKEKSTNAASKRARPRKPIHFNLQVTDYNLLVTILQAQTQSKCLLLLT
jgi:hypothetical protein